MDNPQSRSTFIDSALLALSTILIALSLYAVFVYVPNELTMGAIQRIFYFHVGSATACYISFGIVFFAAILFLSSRKEVYDMVLLSAGEVGFMFCSIVLISGILWGHSAWNTWFRFEPRLVSFLVLWLIFLGFVLLRKFGEPGKVAAHSAILGILGAITVPIVVYSIKLLPAAAQLHPQVLENRGLRDPKFTQALILTTLSLIIFQFFLIRLRFRVERLNRGDH